MKDKNVEPKVFVFQHSKDLQDPVFHQKAVLHKQLLFTLAVAVGLFFSASVAANSMEVEAAIDLIEAIAHGSMPKNKNQEGTSDRPSASRSSQITSLRPRT